MKRILLIILLFSTLFAGAQVKIGDNPNTINANSLLELESTNKGFLPPRVALNSISSVSPLTGTVLSGMLVYSSGGSLTDGFYYWNGTEWRQVGTGRSNMVSKTATTAILKTETFVLASNDITLTLPAITSADNGLEITIKNIGSHTDLTTIQGNSGATIDAVAAMYLARYMGQTFVAQGGNWVIKEAVKFDPHVLVVDEFGSWTTIQEVIDFLNIHMSGPTFVRLTDQIFSVSSTVNINLPYAITFQAQSFGHATITAASGLSNKPLFRCATECYFKMLMFDVSGLAGYGSHAGEDAIRLIGNDTYHEIKDCTFDGFYNTILDSTNAEIWLFECDISNAHKSGVMLQGNVAGVKFRVAETDFISCAKGIVMDKGSNAIVQLMSGAYLNAAGTDSAIIYRPSTFSFQTVFISTNSWDHIGRFIDGFDFSRSDGRDANAVIQNNPGIGDQNPTCNINVLNNATGTSTSSTSTWYKASWTNTSSTTTKWTIANNRITYQPLNHRNAYIIISGNISCNSSSTTINIGIVKNGVSSVRFGETTLKASSSNVPYQFSTVVYLSDVAAGDYFELWVNSNSSSSTVTVQDCLWFVNAN